MAANDNHLARLRLLADMRHFDEACATGAETREIHGECHLGIGQEAVGAGIADFLRKEDALVGSHRYHHIALAKGVSPRALMAEIFEKEEGLCKGRGGHMHPFDMENNFSATGIVGASMPIALGYSYAFFARDEDHVAVASTGDGGTNHGTFHETMNIAAAWKLPLVILVENNGIAISVSGDHATATPTIAERAAAYGAWGRVVDGTSVDAVAEGFEAAMAHARAGKGPAILEATCDRFRGHFEGDWDLYRSKDAKEEMRKRDPLTLYKDRLVREERATRKEVEAVVAQSKADTEALLETIRSLESPAPEGAMDHVFA